MAEINTAGPSSQPKQPFIAMEPPPLPLKLYEHEKSIVIQWSALLSFTCILPEALYFGLRYNLHKKVDKSLTPPTIILLVFSILTICWRAFKLLRKSSTKRPLGGKRWAMDYFQWNIIVGFIIVTAVLASTTGKDHPNLRQASMPQAIVLYLAGIQVLMTAIMSSMGVSCPVRMSSTPAGSTTIPGVYVLMEDVCGVDGPGGQDFRKAVRMRYEASPIFRRMVVQLNWFWGVGTLLVATGTTVIVWVVEDLNVVFALGWSIPWVWGFCGAMTTILWARRALHKERASWSAGA